jgi:hypothetical protein
MHLERLEVGESGLLDIAGFGRKSLIDSEETDATDGI